MKYTKAAKGGIIKTRWAGKVDRKMPLAEYPRPLLKRGDWQCLNGIWDYAAAKSDSPMPEEKQGEILVPYSPETLLSGVGKALLPDEKLYYRKAFDLNSPKEGGRIILHFEAVDWECEIIVNSKVCGTHRGGYLPFSFDITEHVKDSGNLLEVVVSDPTDTMWQQRGKQKLESGSIWYTPTSGIWQTVWLEKVPEEYITEIGAVPIPPGGKVELCISTNTGHPVEAEIYAGSKQVAKVTLPSGEKIPVGIPLPRLWTPDDPFLYSVKLKLETEGSTDLAESYFGMRYVSLQKGPAGRDIVTLNGKPIFINGPLDQGYWPESGMTPPVDEAMVFDIGKMKALGFNTLRKHVKIESRRWYYHADRLGILVIQDMPNGGMHMATPFQTRMAIVFHTSVPDDNEKAYEAGMRSDPESRAFFEEELVEMVGHLKNHPSIIIWCPFNEAWGQFDSERISGLVKEMDPSRLVDHVSGWYDQGAGNFRSIHRYKIKLKKAPKKDKRAFLISEYGGYNFIDKHHLWSDKDEFGYLFFSSIKDLMNAYEKLVNEQVSPLIEDGLCGVIYTQLSDVEIETNGIYTYDRKVLKFDPTRTKSAHMLLYDKFEQFNKTQS
jgi:hypothetical protein